MKIKTNKKGFTLIELLVVVAIIGILAGIVLVSLNSAQERSKKASLQSTLSSVMPVASMCINDNGTIQSPTSNTTGGGNVCSLADIAETWPSLAEADSSYQYMTVSDATISAGDGTDTIVSCNVSTTSCTLQ